MAVVVWNSFFRCFLLVFPFTSLPPSNFGFQVILSLF